MGGRYEVKGRGRIRNRGASGGGTFRSESPQHGQRPSCDVAAVASARSQCPRASHNWLMHWTVNPGRYCIIPPGTYFGPWAACRSRIPPKQLCRTVVLLTNFNGKFICRILRWTRLRCQAKTLL